MNRIFLSFIIILICGCNQYAVTSASRNSLTQIKFQGNCRIEKSFSIPSIQGEICVSNAHITRTCQDGDNGENTEKYVAFPIGRSCKNLNINKDFFPSSIYSGYDELLYILKKASTILRNGSIDGLKKEVSDNLIKVQMLSLVSIGIEPDWDFDKYRLIFQLSEDSAVALIIKEDGSNPEWAEILE